MDKHPYIHWHRQPPDGNYYQVTFSLIRSNDLEGYAAMDEKTLNLVKDIPGYLGYQSVYNGNRGIFISYWKDLESIEEWKKHPIHREAKNQGNRWYAWYKSEIAQVIHQTEKF